MDAMNLKGNVRWRQVPKHRSFDYTAHPLISLVKYSKASHPRQSASDQFCNCARFRSLSALPYSQHWRSNWPRNFIFWCHDEQFDSRGNARWTLPFDKIFLWFLIHLVVYRAIKVDFEHRRPSSPWLWWLGHCLHSMLWAWQYSHGQVILWMHTH